MIPKALGPLLWPLLALGSQPRLAVPPFPAPSSQPADPGESFPDVGTVPCSPLSPCGLPRCRGWRSARRASRALPEWLCIPSPPSGAPAGTLPLEREPCAAAAGGLWGTRASVSRRRNTGYSARSGVPGSPYNCPALGSPRDPQPGARAVLAAPGVEPGWPGPAMGNSHSRKLSQPGRQVCWNRKESGCRREVRAVQRIPG